jgi:hypothetical protein
LEFKLVVLNRDRPNTNVQARCLGSSGATNWPSLDEMLTYCTKNWCGDSISPFIANVQVSFGYEIQEAFFQ